MWKRLERNTGERRKEDEGTKGMKRRKKQGEELRCERKYNLFLSFS
jgi:hypothetical protein